MQLINWLTNFKTRTVVILCVLGLVVLIPTGLETEAMFARVNYPGAGFGGVPLTFDLNLKQANLKTLEAQGTLDLFVTTQYVDIGIILGNLLFFPFLTLLVSKGVESKGIFYKVSLAAVTAFLIAPLIDALENVSVLALIALSSGGDYGWLNFLNSCFTLGKAAFFVIGWLLLAAAVAALVITWLRRLAAHR